MAKRKHRHRRQRPGVIGPALRPVAWSAMLGAAMTAVTVNPAYANPPALTYAEPALPNQVPDAGARPAPAGPVQLPGGAATTVPLSPGAVTVGLGPLAQRITDLEVEVSSLGEQLKQLTIDREQIQAEVRMLTEAWREAVAALHTAETAAETAAEDAYKRAVALPPGAVDSDLRGLGALSRLQQDRSTGSEDIEAQQLKRARETERAAYLAFTDANGRQADANTRFATLQSTFRQRERALLDLRQRNSSQLAAIEREREAREQRLGAGYLGSDSIAGMQAHPKAKKAVQFALAQLGEAYLWGAEGPNRWDCSGLMWGAYRSAGETLPRVSRDQYQATKSRQVSPNALLPGDLVFFSSSRTDASKIHHVGMYIGGGKMVHAPTTGDVVKISTVWWSRFYAATRVVGAVPVAPKPAPTTPGTNPTTPGSGTTTPTDPGPTTPDPGPSTPPDPGPTTPPDPGPTTPPDPGPTTPPDPGPTTPPDPGPTSPPDPGPTTPPDPPSAGATAPTEPPEDTEEPPGAAEATTQAPTGAARRP
jgi:cell wall-associated NlpC family hydrolase